MTLVLAITTIASSISLLIYVIYRESVRCDATKTEGGTTYWRD